MEPKIVRHRAPTARYQPVLTASTSGGHGPSTTELRSVVLAARLVSQSRAISVCGWCLPSRCRKIASMDALVFVTVLAAAFLHAGWNAVVKVGLDRFSSVLHLSMVQSG